MITFIIGVAVGVCAVIALIYFGESTNLPW